MLLKSFAKSEGSKSAYDPAFLHSSVMSLAPKIDEVREVVQQENCDVVYLVETWLQDHIHDNVVHVPGYNLIRRDRKERASPWWGRYICERHHSVLTAGRIIR